MATRCHILRLNVLHSIPAVALPQTRWGCLQRFPDSLDGFEGPYFKGKGVEGKKREGKGSFCLLHSLSVGIFATSEVFATRNFVVFIDTHIRFVWQSADTRESVTSSQQVSHRHIFGNYRQHDWYSAFFTI